MSWWRGRRQRIAPARDAYVAEQQHFHSYGVVGGPAFSVDAFEARPPAELDELIGVREQPSMLLTAGRQTVLFTGRDRELAELRQWWDSPSARSVWVWHAAGGQGKTRLANHAAGLAAAAGWRVGVARHRDDTPVSGQLLADGQERVLVVVDYAERWPPSDLFRLLADCGRRAPLVRVLLLARSIAWWPAAAGECDKLGFSIGAGQPRLLTPLAEDVPGRQALFAAACSRFAEIYQLVDPPPFAPAGDLCDDQTYGLTLGLHMAALAAVDAHARAAEPPQQPGDVSRYLLDRERSYWTRLSGPDEVGTAARTVLLACLAGAQLPADGLALIERTGLAPAATGQKLLDAHSRCYPPSQTGTVLEPLYPDRLAEDFIALSLPGGPVSGHTDVWATTPLVVGQRIQTGKTAFRPGPLFADGPDERPPAHAGRVLLFLAAAAGRNEHVGGWLRTLLTADPALAVRAGGAALLAVTPHTTPDLAEAIYWQLPERSIDLDDAAALLAAHLFTSADTAVPDRYARLSGILAFRLSQIGRHQQALGPAGEATIVYRRLAETDPDAYLPDLAMSLTNLTTFLARLGRREQALGPVEEATGIYRQLAESNPDTRLPELAASLNNLGMSLSAVGQRERALGTVEEATHIYRRLAEIDPGAHLPDLAMSLCNLGVCLSVLGKPERALQPTMEANGIYRRLVERDPDAYLPSFALSSGAVGQCLTSLGEPAKAFRPAEEAIAIHRRLAESNPEAYAPNLALSLLTYADACVNAQANLSRGLKSVTEAINLYQSLADHLPEVVGRYLHVAHHTLADLLDSLGRTKDATQLRRQLDAQGCDLSDSVEAFPSGDVVSATAQEQDGGHDRHGQQQDAGE